MKDYSDEFDRLRKNRVELSRIKYGPARENFGRCICPRFLSP